MDQINSQFTHQASDSVFKKTEGSRRGELVAKNVINSMFDLNVKNKKDAI